MYQSTISFPLTLLLWMSGFYSHFINVFAHIEHNIQFNMYSSTSEHVVDMNVMVQTMTFHSFSNVLCAMY